MHGLMLLAVGLLVAAAPPKKVDVKKELQQLQGTWRIVAIEINGNKLSDDDLKNAPTKLILKGNKYTLEGGEGGKGTFKADPTKKPKTVDSVPSEGDNKGKTIKAIYEIDGDTMKACYDISGKTRPKDFTTKDMEGYVFIEYKREKKKDD
jgi:uncharacterized protein (TIGR03067 family)